MSAEKIQPNPEEAPTQDAELAAEGMQSGNEKKQFVDVEADYEASKQYSVSEMDKSGKGEEAAKEATSSNKKPQNMTDQPEETQKIYQSRR